MSSGLFFDQDWFDERLSVVGQTRVALAQAAGMSVDEVEMVFRDQRELVDPEVQAFARVLAVDPSEIASRSGASDMGGGPAMMSDILSDRPRHASGGAAISGPRPELLMTREAVTGLHERLDRIERLIEMIVMRLDKGR